MEQLFRLRFVSAVKSDYGYIIVTMLAVALFVVSLFMSVVPEFTLALGLAIQQGSAALFFVLSLPSAGSSKSKSSPSTGSSDPKSSASQVPPKTPPSPSSKAKARRRLLFMACLYAALCLVAFGFAMFALLDPNRTYPSQPNSAVNITMLLLSSVGRSVPVGKLAWKHLRKEGWTSIA
ncbi:hypothetical protein NKR19_g10336 [Coniochaeta hoffmannii]|uniref:Uncharacterized protein n=1 Tax=Coniochaeta hoffmannii TaxID=91930 RepID=A0AA38R5L3_9PEZI|nr:hypothetical protein NKR19_g10336 [Coniochaeta hoffmannii]